MPFLVTIAAEATRCIEDQIAWYEVDESHGGPELADRWLELLQKALVDLESNPEGFGFAPENGKWQPQFALRQMPFKPWKKKFGWRLLFVVDHENHHVTIIQIRHERRPLLDQE